jgi:hypothetical protein
LNKLFSLGRHYLTGIFPPKKNSIISKGDLNLVICKKCSLVQLDQNFNVNEMYGDNYGYMSSLNKSMIAHLKLKAIGLKKRFNLKEKNNILI